MYAEILTPGYAGLRMTLEVINIIPNIVIAKHRESYPDIQPKMNTENTAKKRSRNKVRHSFSIGEEVENEGISMARFHTHHIVENTRSAGRDPYARLCRAQDDTDGGFTPEGIGGKPPYGKSEVQAEILRLV